MKRATRQRLMLMFAVAALLALAGWQWHREALAAPGTLLKITPASIRRIALTLTGTPTMHYEKRAGHWWRVDGAPTRADDGRLTELANTAAAEVLSWRPASDFRAARIGLAPPVAVLVLNGHTLAFGGSSVTGPQNYVQVGDRVALVSQAYMPRPPTSKIIDLH